jgi:2-polyprenyl-3-methyl-5-hydroxy-6-metoxy-1,4-benzoquinol methylase
MTYGEEHGTAQYLAEGGGQQTLAPGSPEFFQQIDRMLESWNRPLHDETGPFGRIFDYARYKDKSVLEVGCGMGSLAMYWAQRGARMTAVDLTRTAVERTTQRFALLGLSGTIRQEDGRHLSFPDDSFDYAYSWGVLHHSPDLASTLRD